MSDLESSPVTVSEPSIDNATPGFVELALDETGQDLIEYALVAALIGLGAITAVRGLGTSISSAFTRVSTNLTTDT